MVGSLDVQALYPSLDQEESAKIVEKAVFESNAKISGVNYRAAQVYVASSMSYEEAKSRNLLKLLPRRVFRMGKKPGPTTTELGQKVSAPAPAPTQTPGSDRRSTSRRTTPPVPTTIQVGQQQAP